MGKPLPEVTIDDSIRIWANIIKRSEDKCWNWVLSLDSPGYPRIRIKKSNFKVSRIVYKLHYGIDPNELHVLHECDNPICCNPYHLFLGTDQDNVTDMENKGRSFYKKLNKCDLDFAISERKLGTSYREIARHLGCNHTTVINNLTKRR